MNRVWAYLTIALSIRAGFIHDYGLADSLIERSLEQVKENPSCAIEFENICKIQERHFFLVSGFMNGLAQVVSSYYTNYIDVLKHELGVGVTDYGPSTGNNSEENIEPLHQKIIHTFKKHQKPIVLIGHSKGAKEIFLLLTRHPHLIINGIVDRAVLIQAALYGSPLIPEDDLSMPLSVISLFAKNGLKSLSPTRSETEIQNALNHLNHYLWNHYGVQGKDAVAAKWQEISDKIFYVRSYQDQDRLSLPLKMIRKMCSGQIEGQNDGLLRTQDMKCNALGIDLGEVRWDHIATTVYIDIPLLSFLKVGSYMEQRELLLALLRSIFS
jgi:hypothetical protein